MALRVAVAIGSDGRFVGTATPAGDTSIRVRGGRVELSVGVCGGSSPRAAR
jgi:hypothetical protein